MPPKFVPGHGQDLAVLGAATIGGGFNTKKLPVKRDSRSPPRGTARMGTGGGGWGGGGNGVNDGGGRGGVLGSGGGGGGVGTGVGNVVTGGNLKSMNEVDPNGPDIEGLGL